MTREEAIARIKDHMEHHRIGKYSHIKLAEALDTVLSVLRGTPVTREPKKIVQAMNVVKYAVSAFEDFGVDRLRELAHADREGRCVVLPCKIGDTVYSIRHERVPDDEYRMSFHTEMRIISQKFGLIHADCIGKSVFLTREQAEAALNKMKEAESE